MGDKSERIHSIFYDLMPVDNLWNQLEKYPELRTMAASAWSRLLRAGIVKPKPLEVFVRK